MKKDFAKYQEVNKLIDSENFEKREGKFTPRERLSFLFDNGDYKELFKYASVDPTINSFKDGVVCAFGSVNGKTVFAYASEFSFEGGSVGVHQSKQMLELFRLAKNHAVPVVALVESGGAKITDSIDIMESFAGVMRESVFLSGFVPQITCTLGHCIGASAFVALFSDFIIMEKNSNICISGANVNKAATGEDVTQEEIGGADIHSKHSGAAHFVIETEEKAILKIRELLSFLPSNNQEKPPVISNSDSETREEKAVYEILPEDPVKPFDIRKLITLFSDNNDFMELQADYAKNLVVGFARFGGIPVGIVANQPLYMGGAIDTKAFKKMARFMNFLSAYNFPMLNFVDVPGAVPTSEEHKRGILNAGASALQALGHHKHLKITILVRKCFGGAYSMLNPKITGGDIIYAYPNASIGIMNDKAMSSVLGKNSKLSDKVNTLHENGLRLDHPILAASGTYIDDIILPEKTREEIIRVLKAFPNKFFLDIPKKEIFNFTL